MPHMFLVWLHRTIQRDKVAMKACEFAGGSICRDHYR